MKLNEISGRDRLSYEWMKWIENNFTVSEGQKMLTRISPDGDLVLPNSAELYGDGKPFNPPGKITGGRWVGLNDYDFTNSDFSNLEVLDQLELYVTDETNGKLGDLAEVVRKIASVPKIVSRMYMYVSSPSDRISNVCAAAEIFPHFILRINNYNGSSELLSLDATREHVTINGTGTEPGTTHFYSNVFELQEILIDNGFEDIA